MEALMELYNRIAESIEQLCSCSITTQLNHDNKLRCFPRNESVIIFETKAYSSNDTITLLEQSIQYLLSNLSSNNITVDGNRLRLTNSVCTERTTLNISCVDKFFPIFDEDVVAENDDDVDDDDDDSSKSDHDSTGTVVGIIIAALLIILLAIIAAVILMVVYYKRRRSYK